MRILLVLLLSAQLALGQTAIVVGSINKTVFADQYAHGSNTGGIAEAYADCPSTGCKVMLGADVTITSPQTLTIADNKPMILDLAGRTITVSNSSGVGLTFTANDINTRTLSKVENGTLTCSWSASSLTAYKWSGMVGVSIDNVNFKNCDHSGTAVLWDDVEDSRMDAVQFRGNGLGFKAQNATNQNQMNNVWFDSNVNAVLLKDVGGITFKDCLVQSNTGQHAFSAISSPGNNAIGLHLEGCHLENNGDGTAASRNLYIAPAVAQVYLGISLIGNTFTRGANAPGGTAIEIAGSQAVKFVNREVNLFNGYSTGQYVTGEANGFSNTVIGDIESGSTATTICDVCLNPVTSTGNNVGVVFNPAGAARTYQIYAGWPAQFDGTLEFWNLTANESILSFNGTTWNVPKNMLHTGTDTFQGDISASANIDFGSGKLTTALNSYKTDSGTILESFNTSAANAAQLAIKHNSGDVELDNLRGGSGGFIFGMSGTGKMLVNGGVQVNSTGSKPTCALAVRGMFWVTQSGAGVKDAVEVCAKDAADAYAWRTIY